MDNITLEARIDNLNQVLDFVNERLEANDCPVKTQIQIDVAVEEIFVNVASYAYTPDVGSVTVCVAVGGDPLEVTISFTDSGIPYDPLAKEDPDVTLSAEQRQIGGLGIYMVKKSMDHVSYEHKDGQNVFTIRKNLL
ncbi:MAG: ATP-binding protein [Lachnospiraceae bacterium]|nr:ATP-binding protein [Lachnospiraceae bacterium]